MYRSREQALIISIIGLGGAVFIAGLGLAFPAPWEERVIWVALGLAVGYFCIFRVARSGVFIEDGGVRVLKPLRTFRLSWDRIQEFTLKRHGPFPVAGHLRLIDGSFVHIFGIQAPNRLFRPNDQSAQDIVKALNTRLEEARA